MLVQQYSFQPPHNGLRRRRLELVIAHAGDDTGTAAPPTGESQWIETTAATTNLHGDTAATTAMAPTPPTPLLEDRSRTSRAPTAAAGPPTMVPATHPHSSTRAPHQPRVPSAPLPPHPSHSRPTAAPTSAGCRTLSCAVQEYPVMMVLLLFGIVVAVLVCCCGCLQNDLQERFKYRRVTAADVDADGIFTDEMDDDDDDDDDDDYGDDVIEMNDLREDRGGRLTLKEING